MSDGDASRGRRGMIILHDAFLVHMITLFFLHNNRTAWEAHHIVT